MFALKIATSIDIQAPATEVWSQLVDFASYPEWNPMLTQVNGVAELDKQVNFSVAMPDKPLKLKANINVLDNNRALHWAGGIPLLLHGEHYFQVEELTPDTTRFHHGEYFKGLLLPLLSAKLKKEGPQLYDSMNEALKQRIESVATLSTNIE